MSRRAQLTSTTLLAELQSNLIGFKGARSSIMMDTSPSVALIVGFVAIFVVIAGAFVAMRLVGRRMQDGKRQSSASRSDTSPDA